MPTKKPRAGSGQEASAKKLNPRGMPYEMDDLRFPPGEWVAVTDEEAEALARYGWVDFRDKKSPEPAAKKED